MQTFFLQFLWGKNCRALSFFLPVENVIFTFDQATLDNLTETLEELGGVKSHLVTIQNRTLDLQEKVRQLDLGLRNSKSNLKSALQQCSGSAACKQFLRENNIDLDLNIAADFLEVPFELPDVSLLMSDISDLVKVHTDSGSSPLNYGRQKFLLNTSPQTPRLRVDFFDLSVPVQKLYLLSP